MFEIMKGMGYWTIWYQPSLETEVAMALTIDKGRTALLAMDFQSDIVDEKGTLYSYQLDLM